MDDMEHHGLEIGETSSMLDDISNVQGSSMRRLRVHPCHAYLQPCLTRYPSFVSVVLVFPSLVVWIA